MAKRSREWLFDACILLDLDTVGLLSTLAKLPHRLIVTDFLAGDLQRPTLSELVGYGLVESGLTGAEMKAAGEILTREKALSFPDAAALALAQSRSAILLTGDRALFRAAKKSSVECRGTLWLMDQLVEFGILDTADATIRLERMFLMNRRLPAEDSSLLIRKWEGGMKNEESDL